MRTVTRKLYEENAYCKRFTAKVVSCTELDSAYSVVLDQTAFFPEAGGQSADTGMIGNKQVRDVQINNDIIIHILDDFLEPGATIECEVDWERRFTNMQNHTGEHIVSGLIHSHFGLNNIGFHLENGIVSLDVDGKLSAEQLQTIEAEANAVVYENRDVIANYPTQEELYDLVYRSKIKENDHIRIVTVDGCDCCACCAPHVSKTGEIGIIKIIDSFPNKGGTRIEILCGHSALNDYIKLHRINGNASKILAAGRYSVDESIKKVLASLANSEQEIKKLKRLLAYSQLNLHICGKCVYGFVPATDYDALTYCTNNLLKTYDVCCVFSEQSNNSFIYVLNSRESNLKPFVSELNKKFNGKGGGKNNFAQGKISGETKEIGSFVEKLLILLD